MDLKDIKQIIKVLEGTDVSEIEIEQEGVKVKVKRGGISPLAPLPQLPPPVYLPPRETEVIVQSSVAEKAAEKESAKLKGINSPMVGTFYIAPSPDAPAFVKVGDMVTKGQTLCIIEAMKLMNEIDAECSGKIVSILVQNAQPVEYGTPLFMIDPA